MRYSLHYKLKWCYRLARALGNPPWVSIFKSAWLVMGGTICGGRGKTVVMRDGRAYFGDA